jgi:Domain of unknown function (DUF892)
VQTREHGSNIFERFREKPKGKKCEGMKGVIAEEETLLPEEPQADPTVLDAASIACVERAEHYEVATTERCNPMRGHSEPTKPPSCFRLSTWRPSPCQLIHVPLKAFKFGRLPDLGEPDGH